MLPALFERIDKSAIDQLILGGVSESQWLDYKQQLPDSQPKAKTEFLADIASFANSSGGDLIFGVVERRDGEGKPTGTPEAARGVGASVNIDSELLRLQHMINEGIAPRIPVRTVVVSGFPEGPILVLRIPRTITGPHMVTFERKNRFYGRTNTTRLLLDVESIRRLFNASADGVERALRFRDSRVAALVAGETPVRMTGAALILHVIPQFIATRFDVRGIGLGNVPMPMAGGGQPGYVAEGLVFRAERGYTLVMRDTAIVETAHNLSGEIDGKPRPVSPYWVARESVRFVRRVLEQFARLDVSAPYLVLSTFAGVKGREAALPAADIGGGAYVPRKFDRDLLALADVELPSADSSLVTAAMQPVFDSMWQALGEWRDPSYANGESAKW